MIATSAVPTLVLAKLAQPQLAPHHVPRNRLLDQLTIRPTWALTLLSAPAGSGKSTLVSEWLRTVLLPGAWVSLDERDNEVGVFLSYVLAALHSAAPLAVLQTQDLLQTTIPPPLDVLAASLSNDLHQLGTGVILVLDDYHVIRNPQIHEILERLIEHPPRHLHLVIATREELPWSVAHLRARGQLMAVPFSDLQFSEPESATFLRTRLGDDIPADLASALHESVEGWPAGLQLLTAVLDDHHSWEGEIARLSQASGDVADVLLAEVFSRLPRSQQDDLLRLAILDWLTPPLCAALCGHDGSALEQGAWGRDLLTSLEQAGLLLVPLRGRRETLRFHHLVRQFLAARLRERFSPAEIAELHQRASDWFTGEGQIEVALDHALAAGNNDAAAHLVAENRQALYNREHFAILARWLQRLPDATIEDHAELLMAATRVATYNWQFPEAAALLDRAAQALATWPTGDAATEVALGELTALQMMLNLWTADADRLYSGALYALQRLPLDATHLRGHAHTAMAASLYLRGQPEQAVTYLDEQLVSLSPHSPTYAALLHAQARLYWMTGDLTKLSDTVTRLLHVSESLELPELQAIAHGMLGAAHYARNELDQAAHHLTQAVAARFTLRLLWWCEAAGVLALTYLGLGHAHQARETLADAHELILERHALRILPNIGAYQAEFDRRQGRLAEASRWAGQVEPGPWTLALMTVEPRLVRARVFLSQDTALGREYAAVYLGELRAYSERIPNRRLLMEIDALEALLMDRRGQEEAALTMLECAVTTGLREGWVRPFVDLGPRMASLLSRLAPRFANSAGIAQLLNAFTTHDAPAAGKLPLGIEPISAREREILQALYARESNKEIAARLLISPNTVRRHTINLYRKLGVNDRRLAVERARELGLLPLE